jgi:hypothetical protein
VNQSADGETTGTGDQDVMHDQIDIHGACLMKLLEMLVIYTVKLLRILVPSSEPIRDDNTI